MNEKDLLNILKDVDIFKGLDDKSLEKILSISTIDEYSRGYRIFEDQSVGDDLYVLLDGEVLIKIEKLQPDFDVNICKVEKGEIFGELALIDDAPRSATAECNGPAKLLTINGKKLRELMEKDYKIGYYISSNIAKTVCSRIRNTNSKLLAAIKWRLG